MIGARIVVALALGAGLASAGCAAETWRWPTLPWTARAQDPPGSSVAGAGAAGDAARVAWRRPDPAGMVARADECAQDGKPQAARELYDRVVREYPDEPVRAGALFGLGLLYADPSSSLRDYRAAYASFGRILAEHPRSRWEANARLWRAMLHELFVREDEAVRLRGQLQRLKRIEVDLDKSR
jgi:tetratricopeptide (TPR) repeat protein